MSMEHKAFVFDTKKFHTDIEPVMKESIRDIGIARQYISGHLGELQSPYTGDTLEDGWEAEFGDLTLQECFDILLTACYDVDDDCGLSDMWDAVNEVTGSLEDFYGDVMPVLGRGIEIDGVTVDPGMQGLGIVESDEVASILAKLKDNREEAENAEPEDLLYEAEPEEWIEAYDSLCDLYEEASQQGKGLLFTF